MLLTDTYLKVQDLVDIFHLYVKQIRQVDSVQCAFVGSSQELGEVDESQQSDLPTGRIH